MAVSGVGELPSSKSGKSHARLYAIVMMIRRCVEFGGMSGLVTHTLHCLVAQAIIPSGQFGACWGVFEVEFEDSELFSQDGKDLFLCPRFNSERTCP